MTSSHPSLPGWFSSAQLHWLRWVTIAVFWLLMTGGIVAPISIGWLAYRSIVDVPDPVDCSSPPPVDEQLGPRLYCAQMAADEGTPQGLYRAIGLAQGLPLDHPSRPTVDRLIQTWSLELLRLAEEEFQAGSLDQAQDTVRLIPLRIAANLKLSEKVEGWKTTWVQAETIYSQVQKALDQEEWYQALDLARQLQEVDNRYWRTTKYDELMDSIPVAYTETRKKPDPKARPSLRTSELMARWQQDRETLSRKRLDRAIALAETGNADSLRSAILEAQMVMYDTPSYSEAQQRIKTWDRQLDSVESRAPVVPAETHRPEAAVPPPEAAVPSPEAPPEKPPETPKTTKRTDTEPGALSPKP